MASINLLADHYSESIRGGVRISGLSTGLGSLILSPASSGGNSNINQTGSSNNANIGNTGFSLFSVGAIYF